jgi:hypothetical protein
MDFKSSEVRRSVNITLAVCVLLKEVFNFIDWLVLSRFLSSAIPDLKASLPFSIDITVAFNNRMLHLLAYLL